MALTTPSTAIIFHILSLATAQDPAGDDGMLLWLEVAAGHPDPTPPLARIVRAQGVCSQEGR